jgi:hypothetical protein
MYLAVPYLKAWEEWFSSSKGGYSEVYQKETVSNPCFEGKWIARYVSASTLFSETEMVILTCVSAS